MLDNDVALQTQAEANYQLLAGANEQGNFATYLTIIGDYDLVIVLGDYHELNFIWQKNVLFDPDTVMALGSEGDGSQSITTGTNWLHNEAMIEQFGTDAFHPMGANWLELAGLLTGQEATLDLALGLGIPNFGDSTFDVLVVTGSMYDLNLIAQENVVGDADVIAQMLPEGADADQVIRTGDNALGNFAAIVRTGPAADAYIGGDFYEDEMLIQSELVVADSDAITLNDPDELASELVVFATAAESEADCPDPAFVSTTASAGHHDLLGGALT
jgi:hypothetical protein